MLIHIKELFFNPKLAWQKLKEENISVQKLFFSYGIFLAAIPALVHFLSYGVLGLRLGASGFSRMPTLLVLFDAVLIYIMSLASLIIVGVLAHYFSQEYQIGGDLASAMKLSVFGLTPVYLAWVFQIMPALSILSYLAFYGAYVMLQGILTLYKSSSEKITTFAVLIIVCSIILQLFIFHLNDFLFSRWILSEFMTY